MANGDLLKLGTLYVNGTKQARPTRPWTNNTTVPGQTGTGDIPSYSSGNIEIRNTDSSEAYQIYWREVNDGAKKLLVADRNILASVSWDQLSAQGLVFGKEITIDSQKYKVRILTGGTDRRVSNDSYSGGTPTNNDWDRIITREAGFSGLPAPSSTDLDSSANETDMNSTHNKFWNWFYMYSWVQETYVGNTGIRVVRGFTSARNCNWDSSSNVYPHFGFRPVLEVLNSAPLISDSDRSLGTFSSPVEYNYSVTESDGDNYSIAEYLDNVLIRSLSGQVSGTQFAIDLTDRWADVSNAQHTIKIEAIDVHSAKSTRTLTFNKISMPPGAPVINTPIDKQRVEGDIYIEFTPDADPEGDDQTMALNVADNDTFTSGLQTFTTLEKLNEEGEWEPASTVTAADIGSKFRIEATGLPLYSEKYMRVGATDEGGSNTTIWSQTIGVRIGTRLEVQSLPFACDYQPRRIVIKDKASFAQMATTIIYVCNNALDDEPTWEDATEAYQNDAAYIFANVEKTADSWATAIRYVVLANDATDEISISSIGAGVS